jgi:hypothetical protein
MFEPKLNALDDAGFDWVKYDGAGFGTMNHLGVIHSGYGAESGNPGSDCNDSPSSNRIWSQGAIQGPSGGWTSKDFFALTSFFVSSAYSPELCMETPGSAGSYIHEFLHGFGLIDIYDNDEDEEPISLGGTGSFDIMCNYYGWYVAS